MNSRHDPLPQLLRQRVSVQGHDTLLQIVGGECCTYGQLHRRALQWAQAFRSEGLNPGDRIIVLTDEFIEGTAAWLGVSWIRGAAVVVHATPAYRGKVLERICRENAGTLLLISPSLIGFLDEVDFDDTNVRKVVGLRGALPPARAVPSWVSAEEFLKPGAEDSFPGPADHDVALVTYTSGSTGPAKGVLVYWRQVTEGTQRGWLGEPDRIEGQYRFYVPLPSSWAPFSRALYWIVFVGGLLVVRNTLDAKRYLADITEYGCHSAFINKWLIEHFLRDLPADYRPPESLRYVTIGGGISRGLDEFKKRFGVSACTAYGMTELPAYVIGSRGFTVDDSYADGCCGYARDGYEMRVVDETDEPVAQGQTGELIIRSSMPWALTGGYVGQPEQTVRAWRNGWFHTGDAFFQAQDGRYFFVDRLVDLIRRDGMLISSTQLENLIRRHSDVGEAAVVLQNDAEAADCMVAYVTPRASGSIDMEDLQRHLSQHLAPRRRPDRIAVLEELPRTASGKLDKPALRRGVPADRLWA